MTKVKITKNGNILLKDVRLSFPSIFERSVFEGKEGKYQATFLLPKEDEKGKALIDKLIKEKLQEAKLKVSREKLFIKDGNDIFEEKGYEGYEDHWALKCSTDKDQFQIMDRDGQTLESKEGKKLLYAGARVHGIVGLWIQNNAYGKRVNANLLGIRFTNMTNLLVLE